MGLGLPVCEKCQVICDHQNLINCVQYYCPICGNTDPKEYSGLTEHRWKQLEDNYKFLKFVLKK